MCGGSCIRKAQVTGGESGRGHHDLARPIAELIAFDVLELNLQHPRLLPFALGAEPDGPHYNLEGRVACVGGQVLIVEALRVLGAGTEPDVYAQMQVVAQAVEAIQGLCPGR
jgi:hypothetical protein